MAWLALTCLPLLRPLRSPLPSSLVACSYCCQDRCPNTVHAWQLGWLKVRQLDATTLRAGRTVSLTLPSQSRSSLAGLRVLTSWWVQGGAGAAWQPARTV